MKLRQVSDINSLGADLGTGKIDSTIDAVETEKSKYL